MRQVSFALFGVLLAAASLGAGACSSSSGADTFATHEPGTGGAGDEGYGGSGTTTWTTGTYPGSSSSGSSSSSGWAGSGGSGGATSEDPNDPSNPPGSADAGADAAPVNACDGLDQSQPLVLYISADDSNSMASPVHAREALRLGAYALPPIRTYEFLNYYDIAYTAPPAGQLAIFPQAEPGADPGAIDLQIGVRSFEPVKPRRPMTITFVLDTSGSMSGDSIERERAVVKAVAKSLAPNDIVNMVTWNDTQAVILDGHQATGPNDTAVLNAANALSADGSTNLHMGLVTGYNLANKHYGPTRLNRVILVSDGGANTGITDEDIIAKNSQDNDKEGIYLVGVGTGPAWGYNDLLMDTVTDKGRGAYVYIDSLAEANRIFHDRFDEVMEIAARAVQVQLTLPWYFQMQKFYGEGYSTNPIEIPPQHLAPGDAMIFNQVLKACDPALVNGTDTIKVRAAWQAPLTYESLSTEVTLTVDDLLASPKAQLHKGKAIVAYAEALKTGQPADLAAAYDKIVAANPGSTDKELSEIASLIVLHPSFPH